ncbi:hypothetical protein BJV82DRAFT_600197 [Fennellomyces sp. T-0311]|nr:hypothetical protein BJV82DRAFT_600197 [Fennellomyces sp. T-0311]
MESNTAQAASPESSGGFKANVKHYINSLPLLSFWIFSIVWVITLADLPIFLTGNDAYTFRHWLCLRADKVINGFQGMCSFLIARIAAETLRLFAVHRIFLYPLATPGLFTSLVSTYLALPYMVIIEQKYGTSRLAWHLISVYTCTVGILYTIWSALAGVTFGECGGLSGWAVALSVWIAREKEPEGQWNDRIFFGVIRIRAKAMPYFINIFYLFFTAGPSFFLGLIATAVAYCCKSLVCLSVHSIDDVQTDVKSRVLAGLLPSDDFFYRFESGPWVKRIASNPRFVSMGASTGGYLPVYKDDVNVAFASKDKADG